MSGFRPIIEQRISDLGLSKRQLAHDIGVHPTNFYRFLSGKSELRSGALERLFETLEIRVN